VLAAGPVLGEQTRPVLPETVDLDTSQLLSEPYAVDSSGTNGNDSVRGHADDDRIFLIEHDPEAEHDFAR
jgi:hypothetical protein